MLQNTLRTLIFTLIAPCMVGLVIPWLLGGNCQVTTLTTPLLTIGFLTYAWCAFDFIRRGNGTPDPGQPPTKLVVKGLYRYSRNPMYVGVLLMVLGVAGSCSSIVPLVYMVIAAVIVHLRVIWYEEPTLRRMFGAEYEAYLERVPRWLWVL